MGETLPDFLQRWAIYIAQIVGLGLGGLAGAHGNLLIHEMAGETITPAQRKATYYMGAMLAVVAPGLIGQMFFNIDVKVAGGLGLCAIIAGVLGVRLGSMFITMPLPFLGKKPDGQG